VFLARLWHRRNSIPLSKYYSGHGEEVMREMQSRYGSERGKRIFYATAAKRGLTAGRVKRRKVRRRAT
jgi:hypothetical protein